MKRPCIVAFVLLVSLGVVGFLNAAQQPPAIARNEVLQQDLSFGGREVIQALAVMPPGGASSGRHTHPGEEVIYVLEGTVRFEIEGEPPVVKKAGEAIMLSAGRHHYAVNVGVSTVRALTTYIVEKGKPRTTYVQ
jgi:quercetin dioxygenase-like cupin family protein